MLNEISNHQYCVDTLVFKENLESGFLSLAKRLKKIRDENLFEPQWQSFGEYLNELKLTESKVSKLISVYELFVLDYDIEEKKLLEAGGWSNLYELTGVVHSKEEAESWIDRRINAFEPHFREEIRMARKGLPDDHIHTFYEIKICKDCGHREKIYPKE